MRIPPVCVFKGCCCTMHQNSGIWLGANHVQCQEQPMSKWKSEHLLRAPHMEEGQSRLHGDGKVACVMTLWVLHAD